MSLKLSSPSDNFLALGEEYSNANSRVFILPVPFEATSTFVEGSKNGPMAILNASHEVELFDAVLQSESYKRVGGIGTFEPFPVVGLNGETLANELEKVVTEFLRLEKRIIVLGGEHTSTLGAIKAHCSFYPNLTVVQLDAHSDLRPCYQEDRYNHACAAARILDFHDSLVQVGIRSQSSEDWETIKEKHIQVFYAHDIHEMENNREPWIQEIIDHLGENVYVTFDCDVFDPSVIPATGTPEPGGLLWKQVERFFRELCKQRHLVGMDVSELSPISGIVYPQFTIAKLIYRVIGYAFA